MNGCGNPAAVAVYRCGEANSNMNTNMDAGELRLWILIWGTVVAILFGPAVLQYLVNA